MIKNNSNLISVSIILVFYFFLSWHGSHGFDYKYNIWNSYYNQLSNALSNGNLNLDIQASKELLALKDPYDPEQNHPFRLSGKKDQLQDLSFYKGKIYPCFGVVPAVLIYLPYKILFQKEISDYIPCFIFLAGILIFTYLFMLDLKNKYFENLAPWIFRLSIIVFGCSFLPKILVNVSHYSIPLSSGCFFISGAFYFLFSALKNKVNIIKLIIGSLFLGLSVGCRPTQALTCIILVVLLSKHLLTYKEEVFKNLLAVFLPLTLVLSLIGAYNYCRFENPLESGYSYQLTFVNYQNKDLKTLSLANIPNNVYYYFFAPPRFKKAMPFIEPIKNLVLDKDTPCLLEEIVGVCVVFPILIFGFILCCYLLIKQKINGVISVEFSSLLAVSIGQLVFYSLYFFIVYRYFLDFLPYLMLLSFIVWFYYEVNVPSNQRVRALVRVFGVICSLVSITSGLLLAL